MLVQERHNSGRQKGCLIMGTHQIILANEPRLLRGLLSCVLSKQPRLDVVDEVEQVDRLPAAVERENAEWVVVSLWPDGDIPDSLVSLLQEHASLSLLGIAGDGSEVRIVGPELSEERLGDVSLAHLVAVFRGERED
jgi:hypothetical protein